MNSDETSTGGPRLDEDWMDDAACRSRLDLGWLKEPEDVGLGEEATMATVCDVCPVRTQCDHYADLANITGGFWAGHHRTPDGPLLSFVPGVRPGSGDAA
jgi:hypothetical protein